ncbi:MAG: hypothetical protein HBSAPP03_12500 [Phycisphaerae bacterium]|nr:MAG: hypothetical protein HBSAPP03_12500 [Phycisphaerae bacterium]
MPSHTITNIDLLKNRGLTGNGIAIGMTESGLAPAHLSYEHRVNGRQPVGAGNTADAILHACHVAGIMLSDNTTYGGTNVGGVARNARLWSANSFGGGATHFAAMDWLVQNPAADLINISWGGNPAADPDPDTVCVDRVVHQYRRLVVCAAGNEGNGTGRIISPGDGFNVLTVGATGFGGSSLVTPNYRRIANYSSYGLTTGATMGNRAKVDLVAPGSFIFSASNRDHNTNGLAEDFHNSDFGGANMNPVNGTSFAAPHVTGTAALLMEHATGRAWEAAGKDPLVLKAVLMNGASKNVYDRNNQRWDDPSVAKAANGNDLVTGTGLLDAEQSFLTYQGGRVGFNYKTGNIYGVGGTTPSTGWGTDSVASSSVTQWWTDAKVRKGSYIIATLAWERPTQGNNSASAAYTRSLTDLDLYVRNFADDSTVGSSTSVFSSTEHVVAKMPTRERVKIEAKNLGSNSENFGVAWHTFAAPTALQCFNGDFMGDRGALNDNGWFDVSTHGTSSVLRPSFTNQTADASFAMSLLPDSLGLPAGMAQELVTPTSGFWMRFDVAFTGSLNDHALMVTLGNVDLLTAAGFDNGRITPDGTNTNQYRTYIIDLAYNQSIFSGLTGGFQDLAFTGLGYGGGRINVDNICYIPTTGTLALAGMGMLIAVQRRRRS